MKFSSVSVGCCLRVIVGREIRNFSKNLNTVLSNCQESLGIDYKEEHLYSPVMMGGETQNTFNRQLLVK